MVPTEASPAFSSNYGEAKNGSVGDCKKGVSCKTLDIDSGITTNFSKEILCFRTENIFVVLNDHQKPLVLDAAVLFFKTGDLGRIDEDGFLWIEEVSRFSKIGGEMVPHQKVEEAITRSWDYVRMKIYNTVSAVKIVKERTYYL